MKLAFSALEKYVMGLLFVAVSGLVFVCGFIVAGLDHRFGWSSVPAWVVTAASVVLGSWYALILFAVYPFVVVVRIRGEEQVLEAGLPGYKEYKKKVRYRLIPLIW